VMSCCIYHFLGVSAFNITLEYQMSV
jgi:hypothetical protein